ncbi:hypothetical protein LG202_13610 [Methylobacillus methanolivorans]
MLPNSIVRTIAESYTQDARDFVKRFDLLREEMLHKSGRIKSFIDLLMACECVLKAHVAMTRESDDPKVVYKAIRKAGHDIEKLAKMASWMHSREIYETLTEKLKSFNVLLRYSFDADQVLFPLFIEWDEAEIHYSSTIGNDLFVVEIRNSIELLIDELNEEFLGVVDPDVWGHMERMQEFYLTMKNKELL